MTDQKQTLVIAFLSIVERRRSCLKETLPRVRRYRKHRAHDQVHIQL